MEQTFASKVPLEHRLHTHPLSFGDKYRVWVGEQVWLVPLVALRPGRAAASDSWVQMEHSSPGCT